MKKILAFIVAVAAALAITLPAQALTLGFDNISANNIGDAAIGEAQLFVDVTDIGSNQIQFYFTNTGPDASSICQVYFDDDGSLLSMASIINGTGVSFSVGGSPNNLPAGNNATPPFDADFRATADSPVQPNGVNPGENLAIICSLQGGSDFGDVLDALASGALRIGVHVQGFASGGSESFVNTPVPVPAALLLFGSGLLGLLGLKRREV